MSIVTPERPVDASAPPSPRPRRHWWQVVNSVVALGAVVIGVIALTRSPATKTVEVPAKAAAATPNFTGDPGPALGIPSDNGLNAVPAAPATGGVPSDKYADRIPAYQYDIAHQHAPVSRVDPLPDPVHTVIRR